MSNSIGVIFPYKYEEMWVFDDERVGLIKEPFVSGMPQILDILTQDIPQSNRGFALLFSRTPFPAYQVKLKWKKEEYGGNWYSWQEKNLEGWLCPALFKYFNETPSEIYCKCEQLPRK